MDVDNRNTDPPTPRARSRVACQTCHRRKVRCNVAQTGPPCANCRNESRVCTVVPRKKHKPRRPRASVTHSVLLSPPAGVQRDIDESQFTVAVDDDAHDDDVDDAHDEGARGMTPEADGRLPDDDATSYIGDNRGPRQSVYELCHPQTPQEARSTPAPRGGAGGAPAWAPHEMAFLRHEGAFQTPRPDICDEIVRVYFAHVHFFMPILDVADVLRDYTQHGCQGINPLLCWSMCLAAANFVPSDVLAKTGYSSRKEMKEAMYARAKCLYDLDRSTDKVTLIQAVLLMGFWYTDAYDHTGAWHWVGIAISLAQSLGFHRKPPYATHRNRSNRRQQDEAGSTRRASLVRRIWWTCLVRDRWVALAKGRPMRIHDEDCDVPLPVLDDLIQDFAAASPHNHSLLPSHAQATSLARMWIRLVAISSLLGRIVRSHYRVQGPPPRREDIDSYERELQACAAGEDDVEIDATAEDVLPDDHLLLHKNHVDLFYNATVAILYRPYLLHAPISLPPGATEQWQKLVARRARAAASRTNDILNRLIELDAIHLLKPMTITAFVPAMQIHLFDCKATNPLLRSLGKNKLGLCMLVLSHIRNTYWSASVIHRLFARAQQILQDASSGRAVEELSETTTVTTDTLPIAPLTSTTNRHSDRRETRGPGEPSFQQQQPSLYNQESQHPLSQGNENNNTLNSYAVDMPTPTPTPSGHALLPPYVSSLPTAPPPPPVQPAPPEQSWWDEPATFLNVDLLLSPGFALSDDVCQTLFQSYGTTAGGADTNAEMDMMYM